MNKHSCLHFHTRYVHSPVQDPRKRDNFKILQRYKDDMSKCTLAFLRNDETSESKRTMRMTGSVMPWL
uniref:Uncharacterized protein n=1 Tax=Anguilla anguilla TaxID=7936 RepID=A0A0E9X4A5_ANGAN